MKTVIAIVFLTFGLISPVLADETRDAFERGLAAQRSGDNAAALKHYQFAAERGDADAQGKLGIMYMYGGRGIPQNYVRAHMWLSLAVANASAGTDRGGSVTNSMLIAGLMNPTQIAEAQKLAREWTDTHPTGSQ